jgi:cell division protease FtsH
MFAGVGASRVRDLCAQAAKHSPCIIFIDETDTIGKSRDNQIGGNDEWEQTLNQLLSEMDGVDSSKSILILAATNRPEILDKVLLRPGRFDRWVIVDRPDLPGREAILPVHGKKVTLGADVDLKEVSRSISGATGADLANMVNEAAMRTIRLGRSYSWKTLWKRSLQGRKRRTGFSTPRKNAGWPSTKWATPWLRHDQV